MRTVATVPLTALCLLAASCGAGFDASVRSKPACPPGEFTVQEVMGPLAPGFELVPGEKKTEDAYAKILRKSMGGELRTVSTRVHALKRELYGTGVIVATAASPLDRYLDGFEEGASETAKRVEPMKIAGADGLLVHAQDDTFFATAQYGRCTLIALYSHRERLMRTTVEQIPEAPEGA